MLPELRPWPAAVRAAWPRRRLVQVAAAAAVGGGLGYAMSQLLLLVTRCNGGCPTATDPAPFVVLLAAVAAWSVATGTRG